MDGRRFATNFFEDESKDHEKVKWPSGEYGGSVVGGIKTFFRN